jgi:hypothetical protein
MFAEYDQFDGLGLAELVRTHEISRNGKIRPIRSLLVRSVLGGAVEKAV